MEGQGMWGGNIGEPVIHFELNRGVVISKLMGIGPESKFAKITSDDYLILSDCTLFTIERSVQVFIHPQGTFGNHLQANFGQWIQLCIGVREISSFEFQHGIFIHCESIIGREWSIVHHIDINGHGMRSSNVVGSIKDFKIEGCPGGTRLIGIRKELQLIKIFGIDFVSVGDNNFAIVQCSGLIRIIPKSTLGDFLESNTHQWIIFLVRIREVGFCESEYDIFSRTYSVIP